MKKGIIILTVGIPASGKSTWAKKYALENKDCVRICRDDYRLMLDPSYDHRPAIEMLVNDLVDNAIKSALRKGFNVILDQTNTRLKYFKKTYNFCKTLANVEIKLFDITLEEALKRNRERDRVVDEDAIMNMFNAYRHLVSSEYFIEKYEMQTS